MEDSCQTKSEWRMAHRAPKKAQGYYIKSGSTRRMIRAARNAVAKDRSGSVMGSGRSKESKVRKHHLAFHYRAHFLTAWRRASKPSWIGVRRSAP